MQNDKNVFLETNNEAVDAVIERVGKTIILGAPLAAGKPNHLINAFYRRAKIDPEIQLTIATALTLEKPSGKSDLEKRFLDPFAERVFGDYPNLQYEEDRQRGRLPRNVEVVEFYFPPGKYMNNPRAQQHYVSSNYTHVARDMKERGVNVLVQQVCEGERKGKKVLSLSCNADVTPDLVPMIRASGRPVAVVAQLNSNLPFMYGDALVEPEFFDWIVDNPAQHYKIFGPPKMPVPDTDFMIGAHAASLVKDDGELQVGIGSLGDAVIYSLLLRHQNGDVYRQLLGDSGSLKENAPLLEQWGGWMPFVRGLFGATEMVVDGFMHLYKAGILKKKVYDHAGLQRMLNDGRIQEKFSAGILDELMEERLIHPRLTRSDFDFLNHWGIVRAGLRWDGNEIRLPDGTLMLPDLKDDAARFRFERECLGKELRHGNIVHGGFFLGPQEFYQWLRDLPKEERQYFAMKSVRKINQLYGHEELDRLHRKNARFINSCMMTTLSGAHVSDGLEDGRVVSGVGGQYNFVAMAQELLDGRSILTMRSTRTSKGGLRSNIVPHYGHITVPRHMRDILITEYGIADLRGKTDRDIIAALLNVADSRFQGSLMAQAKAFGKLESSYEIPASFRNNYPARISGLLTPLQKRGMFPRFPLGTDLTEVEQKLGKALNALKADQGRGKLYFAGMIARSWFAADGHEELLKRMKLDQPANFREKLYRKLLLGKLNASADR